MKSSVRPSSMGVVMEKIRVLRLRVDGRVFVLSVLPEVPLAWLQRYRELLFTLDTL